MGSDLGGGRLSDEELPDERVQVGVMREALEKYFQNEAKERALLHGELVRLAKEVEVLKGREVGYLSELRDYEETVKRLRTVIDEALRDLHMDSKSAAMSTLRMGGGRLR